MSSQNLGVAWERALRTELGPDFGFDVRLPETTGQIDFLRSDRRRAIELKVGLVSSRDLRAALMQLALHAAALPDTRFTLVAHLERATTARVAAEWEQMRSVLRPDIADRLSVVALAGDGELVLPGSDEEVADLAVLARRALDSVGNEAPTSVASAPWSSKAFEVWKVLLSGWLRNEGPLSVQTIERRSGASYPTVHAALERLHGLGEVERTSNRSATLAGLPRTSLSETLALGPVLRKPMYFVDTTGRQPDPDELLRRVAEMSTSARAIGGVAAARHYDPNFNLNGLPRVDVSVVGADRNWVGALDPALAPASAIERRAGRAVLVLHLVQRRVPGFERGDDGGWFADPAEVLLDLYELRLSEQAEEFVHAVRRRGVHHERS